MANYSLFTCLALLSLASKFCHGFNPKLLNVSKAYRVGSSYSGWAHTKATFYGDDHGAGSTGGACGYQEDVESQPYDSRIVAVGTSLFQTGGGCGKCYKIKCTLPHCSRKSVTVVATDECPVGACTKDHLFDLSGASLDALAIPGEAEQLRVFGIFDVLYKRTRCKFPGVRVTFKVDKGSNSYYLAIAIEYENGDGVKAVKVKQANSKSWVSMTPSWGSLFKVQFSCPYQTPLSFKLTDSSQTIVAKNVIPKNYAMGVPYVSTVNFN